MSDDGIAWGGSGREPTEAEAAFAAALERLVPGLHYWLHGEDGDPVWLLVSMDFVVADVVCDTLRLDFDAAGIRGGWSPASLNWDDGVPAVVAGIDVDGPDGLRVSSADRSPADLAHVATEWFAGHRRRWLASARGERLYRWRSS